MRRLIVLKLLGGLVLGIAAVLALAVYDIGWNGSALFYKLMGRDGLVAACTPPIRAQLVGRGFTPVELVFDGSPSIASVSGSLGRTRSLSENFTFLDGDGGPRIDGRVSCTVRGDAVSVDLVVDQLPKRVT